MKFLTTLLIAALIGLMVYTARRRVWLALRVAGITYIVVLFGRILLSGTDVWVDRIEDLVWPVLIILIAWVVLWLVSTTYERRKSAPRVASGSRRRARGLRGP
jgi:hypothetical protein